MKPLIPIKPLIPVSLTLSLAIMAIMTGCSNSNTPANTSTDTASNTSSTANTSVQAVTINNASEPETLDPHLSSGVQESNIIRQYLEGLTNTDLDGNTIPGMASEWSTDDNKVWTFKIRDANWSNGDPVTAHDFVYSFRRLVDPMTASPYASYLEDAHIVNASDVINGKLATDQLGIKAIDDKTLEITLDEPVPYFPDILFHSSVKPVHQKTVEQFGDQWTSPKNIVVNGPFKPTEWIVNEKIILTRNPSYYDNANTTLETLTILPISSATTDVDRYKAGEIDITASELPPEQFENLKQTLGDELKTGPTLCTYYYDLNNEKPPFNDVRVRKAIALATDRETITEKVLGQGQEAAYQFTPTATAGGVNFSPEWKAWPMEQRVAEAQKLLAEAGYNANNPLKFTLLYDTNEQHKKIATAMESIWRQNLQFININMENQEWKTYLDSRRNGNYEMARARWCGDYNEASTFLNLRKSTNSNNNARYKNPTYDAILAKTVVAGTTDAERKALYEEAESLLNQDMAHNNMFYYANVRLVKPYIKGYSNKDPMDNWQAKYWSVNK